MSPDLLELATILLMFAGVFGLIHRRFRDLETALWWALACTAAALQSLSQVVLLALDSPWAAGLTGLFYGLTGFFALVASRLLDQKLARPRNVLGLGLGLFVVYVGLHMLGGRFGGTGYAIVLLASSAILGLVFGVIGGRIAYRGARDHNVFNVLAAILTVPFVCLMVLAVLYYWAMLSGHRFHLNLTVFFSVVVPVLVALAMAWAIEILDEAISHQKELAETDPLTKAANRRSFSAAAHRVLNSPDGREPSLVVLDIDRFKLVNDTWGHDAGDRVLVHTVNLIRSTLRSHDIVGRLGGEEFAVLLPETSLEQAVHVAERIRGAMETTSCSIGDSAIVVTASFGVVSARQGERFDDVLKRADELMYRAKREGRNRVVEGRGD